MVGNFVDEAARGPAQIAGALLAQGKVVAAQHDLLCQAQAVFAPQPLVADVEQVEQADQRGGVTAHLAPVGAAVFPGVAKTREFGAALELLDGDGAHGRTPQVVLPHRKRRAGDRVHPFRLEGEGVVAGFRQLRKIGDPPRAAPAFAPELERFVQERDVVAGSLQAKGCPCGQRAAIEGAHRRAQVIADLRDE